MLGVSFPPIGFWPLAWGAMIPLFLAVARLPRERAFMHGLVFFMAAYGIPYHWVALHSMATPAVVTTVALMAVVASAAAMIALFAGRGRSGRSAARIIAAASCLLLFEQILVYGPVPFPAAVTGYAMSDAVWLDPVVRRIGVTGVSLLMVGLSAGAAVLVAARRQVPERRARHVQALLVLSAFLAGWISGPEPADTYPVDPVAPGSTDGIRMTLVQPALEPETWADVLGADRISVLEQRLTGLLELIDEPGRRLIVIPETALPAPALEAAGSSPDEWVQAWSTRLGAPLLAGAIVGAVDTGDNGVRTADQVGGQTDPRAGTYRNAALLAFPHAVQPATGTDSVAGESRSREAFRPVLRYEKQILVPFAERVPLADLLPFLGTLSVPAGGVHRYARGGKSAPLSVDGAELGLMICFESLFPQIARRRLEAGANVLVVLTQDGWWSSNAPRRQHLLYSRMRAVETGLPLVQVSVDGETGVFDHHGRLRVLLPSGIPAAQTVDIAIVARRTLFGRTGDTPVHILLVLSLAVAAYRLFRSGTASDTFTDSPR